MEGLVNYSSEEDQDESSYRKVAERGSPPPLKKRTSNVVGGKSSMRGPLSPPPMLLGSTCVVDGGGVGVAGGGGRGSCKEESASVRHRASQRQESRSVMHQRERSGKESRDARHYGNGHGNSREPKGGERQRSKDDRSEIYRSDARRSSRNDHNDRSRQSSSTGHNQYHNSHHSQRHRERYSDDKPRHSDDKPRHSDDKSSSHRYQRSRDERTERPERSTRKERIERISPSHHRRRGDTRSQTPPLQQPEQQHTKRSSHYDKRSHTSSRSRTPTKPKTASRERVLAPLEKARLSALEMERKLHSTTKTQSTSEDNVAVTLPPLVSPPPLMSLPLIDSASKQPNAIAPLPIASGGAGATSAASSVIRLPSYYNASVINLNKYADQMQKRKLLWGAKKVEDTAAKWGNAQFSQDSDGKVASKFMRLMGIKGDVAAAVAAKGNNSSGGESADGQDKKIVGVAPDVKSREAMFSTMEHQYEVARQVTHTMRGVGLGFSSQSRPF